MVIGSEVGKREGTHRHGQSVVIMGVAGGGGRGHRR